MPRAIYDSQLKKSKMLAVDKLYIQYVSSLVLHVESKNFLALAWTVSHCHNINPHTAITRDISPASTSYAVVNLNSIPAPMKAQGGQNGCH